MGGKSADELETGKSMFEEMLEPKKAADYLNQIDENFPGSSPAGKKYFNRSNEKSIKPLAKGTVYNWKKMEDKLAKAIDLLLQDKSNIADNLNDLLGPDISIKEIKELLDIKRMVFTS